MSDNLTPASICICGKPKPHRGYCLASAEKTKAQRIAAGENPRSPRVKPDVKTKEREREQVIAARLADAVLREQRAAEKAAAIAATWQAKQREDLPDSIKTPVARARMLSYRLKREAATAIINEILSRYPAA